MGKILSCLSCKTDDNSRGKCGRKRPRVQHPCDISQSANEPYAEPIQEIQTETRQGLDWKLEDIGEDHPRSAAQSIAAQHASPATTEDDAKSKEKIRLDVMDYLNELLYTVLANVNTSLQENTSTGCFRNSASKGSHFKKSESVPVYLRQTNADYTRRLQKHRQLTAELIRHQNTQSPQRPMETVEDAKKLNIVYSQGDCPHQASSVQLSKNIVDCDKEDSEHTKDGDMTIEGSRQQNDEVFQKFLVDAKELIPVSSAKIIAEKDKNLDEEILQLEKEVFEEDMVADEFLMDAKELIPMSSSDNVAKKDEDLEEEILKLEKEVFVEETLADKFLMDAKETIPVSSSENVEKIYEDLEEEILQLEKEVFGEDTVADEEVTHLSSYLKVAEHEGTFDKTNDDNVTDDITKRPVVSDDIADIRDRDYVDLSPMGQTHYGSNNKDTLLNQDMATCDSNDVLIEIDEPIDSNFTTDNKGNTAEERKNNHNRLTITAEDIGEVENVSAYDGRNSSDSSDQAFELLEEAIVSDETNEATEEMLAILRLAEETMQNLKPSKKQRKRLMRNHKWHTTITTRLIESKAGEHIAEITDICRDILELCLNEINFDIDENRRSQNGLDTRLCNAIHKDRPKEESGGKLRHRDRSLNSDIHIRNKDKCRLEGFGFNYRQQSDQIMLNITKKEVVYAIDGDGICHPICWGSGIIAIDCT